MSNCVFFLTKDLRTFLVFFYKTQLKLNISFVFIWLNDNLKKNSMKQFSRFLAEKNEMFDWFQTLIKD